MAKRLRFTDAPLRRALVIAAVLCIGTSLPAAPTSAQVAPIVTLEILSVEHEAGSLVVGIRAGSGRDAQIRNLSVFVDDVPVALDLGRRDAAGDLALMLVVDTSGSMVGAPMDAAREAGRALIRQLSVNDRVSVVSFADTPLWQVGLTRDHGLAMTVLDYLTAKGSTALYDAVALAGRELSFAPEERRVVLLLSDGQDYGGVSATGRAATIEGARSSGATFYAVGLGPESDAQYLMELADATGGEFYAIQDGQDSSALTALFGRLGGRLGASETYTLPVGVMTQGAHELRVRAVIDGVPASASVSFEVSNSGLLQPSVEPGGIDPASPIHISLGSFAPSSGLTFEIRAGDNRFAGSNSGQVSLDPWSLAPGPQELTLTAYTAGGIAAQESITIDVPTLAPTLTIVVDDDGLVARRQSQGFRSDGIGGRPTLVAYRGGVEIGRSQTGSLTVADTEQPIRFELLSPDGSILVSREYTPPPVSAVSAAGRGGPPLWSFALLPVCLAGAVFVGRRLRRRPLSVADRVLRPIGQSAPTRERSNANGPPQLAVVEAEAAHDALKNTALGVVMVVDSSGRRKLVPLTARPLTVGSSLACDIVLGDPVVRGQHLRLTALQRDEVQVHVLPERGARPHLRAYQADEEWLIAHHGEQIDIGSYSLRILPAGVALEETEAVG